jgi:hypothetical protein
MAVQLNNTFGVEFVSADLALEVNGLISTGLDHTGISATSTNIVSAQVSAEARASLYHNHTVLMIFAPSVFDEGIRRTGVGNQGGQRTERIERALAGERED